MLTKNINFINFKNKKKNKKINLKLKLIIKENNAIIQSLKNTYRNSYKNKSLKSLNKKFDYRIIGMGGSTLGAQAIYDFLKIKIKKNFFFIDNLKSKTKKFTNRPINNVVISKSGNTIETIVNFNTLIKKKDNKLIITENKNNYLRQLS